MYRLKPFLIKSTKMIHIKKILLLAVSILLFQTIAYSANFTLGTLRDGAYVIYLDGEIKKGDEQQFQNLIAKVKSNGSRVTSTSLNSSGGNVGAAVMMALTIQEQRIQTNVPDNSVCASACFLMFAAGVEKSFSSSSRIGVHSARAYLTGEDGFAKSVTVDMARFSKDLGVPLEIIGKMVTHTPDEMAWLTLEDLKAMQGKPQNIAKSDYINELESITYQSRKPNKSQVTKNDRLESRRLNQEGINLIRTDQYVNATTVLKRAYDLNPFDAEIAGNYGYSLYLTDQFETAKYVLTMALKLMPNRGATWINLGQSLAALGQIDWASESFVKYYEYSKRKDVAANQLKKWASDPNTSQSLMRAAQNSLKALNLYFNEDSVTNVSNGQEFNSRQLNQQGIHLIRSKQYLKAEQVLKRAYDLNPGDVEIIGNYGYALFLNTNYHLSKEILMRAIKINPNRSSSWINLGQSLAALGQVNEATDAFVSYYQTAKRKDIAKSQLIKWSVKADSVGLMRAARNAVVRLQLLYE